MTRHVTGLMAAAAPIGGTGCSSVDGPKNGVINFQLAANCPAFNEQTSWGLLADGSLLGSLQMSSGLNASYLLVPGTHTVRWKRNNTLKALDVTSSAFPISASQRVDVAIECVTQ